ncbi:MAG: N-acyl homoserine lactonase family protein [Pseudomonadota bacterium]
MRQYTIHPLVVGARDIDRGAMTYLSGYGRRIWLPVYVFYIAGGDRKILVDTGLDEFMVPPEVGQKYGCEILEFEPALASIGLRPDDIDIIIHTHLHDDHCANDQKCSRAKVYVQQLELDAMARPHPIDYRYFPELLDGVDVVPLSGDAEIADGIRVVLTPGHTPGGQSVIINTAAGKVVITGFCCIGENFPESGGVICPGTHWSATEAYDSAVRVRETADILIALHDLSVGAKRSIP